MNSQLRKDNLLTQRLEEIIFQEVPLWVRRMYCPEVVHNDIESAEKDDEERSGPFRFEADGNHHTSDETNDRNEYTTD